MLFIKYGPTYRAETTENASVQFTQTFGATIQNSPLDDQIRLICDFPAIEGIKDALRGIVRPPGTSKMFSCDQPHRKDHLRWSARPKRVAGRHRRAQEPEWATSAARAKDLGPKAINYHFHRSNQSSPAGLSSFHRSTTQNLQRFLMFRRIQNINSSFSN